MEDDSAKRLRLEDFLPYRLSILSNTVSGSIAAGYAEAFDLSIPEWRVMAVLGRHPGLSAIEVSERTLMDKVAVSRAVAKLLKKGRLERQFADRDRRRSDTQGSRTRVSPCTGRLPNSLCVTKRSYSKGSAPTKFAASIRSSTAC